MDVSDLPGGAYIADTHPDLIKARINKENAEAEHLRVETEAMRVKLDDMKMEARNTLANADEHCVYSFYNPVLPQTVEKCIRTLDTWSRRYPGAPMSILFNSPGGTVVDGFALFDFIRDISSRGHHVTTKAFGIAASMGAVLLQAGDTRIMAPNAFMMLHEGSAESGGTFAELSDNLKLYQRITEKSMDIIASRSNLTKAQLKRKWNRKDYWIDANEALALGLVDEVGY